MDDTLASRIRRELRRNGTRRTPEPGYDPLPEIPGGRYTRQDFFDLEMEGVFRRSWLLAGHVDELPTEGSYKRFTKLRNAPILIVRGRDGAIRAFYNTCRHRGAPVVKDAEGKCNILRCQFHSWGYDLDGRLVNVPDEYEFAGLDKPSRGLIPVRCETHLGLIFINEYEYAPPLLDWLGPVAQEWTHTPLSDWTVDYRWSRIMNCNWKCVVDAFQEVYHINTVHPKTVGLALDHATAAIGLLPHGHSRLCVGRAGDVDDSDIYAAVSVSHTVMPAMISPWGQTGIKFIVVWPIAPGRCEVEVLGVGVRWGGGHLPPEREMANRAFDAILEEDMVNLEPMQASLESGAFSGMMLGHQERRIYWAHETFDAMIGVERIPDGLAVPPLLARHVERAPDLAAE